MEAPGVITYFMSRKSLINRDFKGVAKWLSWQLELAKEVFPGSNMLVPSLVGHADQAVRLARLPEELTALRPFLQSLVEFQPKLPQARLWLARALSVTEPEAALEQLESAIGLSEIDERAYRMAFEVMLRHGLTDRLPAWCGRYRKAQFGGRRAYDSNTLFMGAGMRRMYLEIIDEAGVRYEVGNAGVELGEGRDYEFALAERVSVKSLRLQLGLAAGVSVDIQKLTLFDNGGARVLSSEDLNHISWNGFNLPDGKTLLVSDGDKSIALFPKSGRLGNADKIVISMRFDRLALASPGVCGRERTR